MNTWARCLPIIVLAELLLASPGFAQLRVTQLALLDGEELLNEGERDRYFNVARCACDTPLTIRFSLAGQSQADGRFEVLFGRSCLESDGELDEDCVPVYSADVQDVSGTLEEAVTVSELAGGCGSKREGRGIYAVFDEGNNGEWVELESLDYEVDTEPPPNPEPVDVVAGEELAEVVFEEPRATSDVRRYQVLCVATSTGAQPSFEPDFDTPNQICSIEEVDVRLPACADSQAGASSVTVLGLENGVSYIFEVVAIDDAGNPSGSVFVGEVVPAPEEDLWERYKNAGGAADGDNCFIATAAFGDYDHPMVRVLRRFRDEVLSSSQLGRVVIRCYYWASPGLADWIAQYSAARLLARVLLWPIVGFAAVLLQFGLWPVVLLVLASWGAWGVWRSR